jgi:hypothetical protein
MSLEGGQAPEGYKLHLFVCGPPAPWPPRPSPRASPGCGGGSRRVSSGPQPRPGVHLKCSLQLSPLSSSLTRPLLSHSLPSECSLSLASRTFLTRLWSLWNAPHDVVVVALEEALLSGRGVHHHTHTGCGVHQLAIRSIEEVVPRVMRPVSCTSSGSATVRPGGVSETCSKPCGI